MDNPNVFRTQSDSWLRFFDEIKSSNPLADTLMLIRDESECTAREVPTRFFVNDKTFYDLKNALKASSYTDAVNAVQSPMMLIGIPVEIDHDLRDREVKVEYRKEMPAHIRELLAQAYASPWYAKGK